METNMTAQKIWELSGDMDIRQAIKSYGSPYNAAKQAVQFVFEEHQFNDPSERVAIERRVEEYLYAASAD